MNIQSCVCVTPWVWRGFYWIQGTLYEIADQTYCQDTVLELCWQHWKWEITQISIWKEDNQQCNLSVRAYQGPSPWLRTFGWTLISSCSRDRAPSSSVMAFRDNDAHFATKALHVGQEPEQWASMAVVPPISTSTTYKQHGPADFKFAEYARR